MDETRDAVHATLDLTFRAVVRQLVARGYSSTTAYGLAQIATDHMQEIMLTAWEQRDNQREWA